MKIYSNFNSITSRYTFYFLYLLTTQRFFTLPRYYLLTLLLPCAFWSCSENPFLWQLISLFLKCSAIRFKAFGLILRILVSHPTKNKQLKYNILTTNFYHALSCFLFDKCTLCYSEAFLFPWGTKSFDLSTLIPLSWAVRILFKFYTYKDAVQSNNFGSTNSFKVSDLALQALIHLKFIFVQGQKLRSSFFLLHVDMWFCNHLLKMLFTPVCKIIFQEYLSKFR